MRLLTSALFSSHCVQRGYPCRFLKDRDRQEMACPLKYDGRPKIPRIYRILSSLRKDAALARHLTDLLVGHPMKQNGKRKKVLGKTPFTLGTEEQASFKAIKSLLTSPLLLAYADYSKSFELHTDASFNGSWSTAAPDTRWQEKGHSLREPKSKTSREELPYVQT